MFINKIFLMIKKNIKMDFLSFVIFVLIIIIAKRDSLFISKDNYLIPKHFLQFDMYKFDISLQKKKRVIPSTEYYINEINKKFTEEEIAVFLNRPQRLLTGDRWYPFAPLVKDFFCKYKSSLSENLLYLNEFSIKISYLINYKKKFSKEYKVNCEKN